MRPKSRRSRTPLTGRVGTGRDYAVSVSVRDWSYRLSNIVISTPSLFITFLWESFSLSIPILDIWDWKIKIVFTTHTIDFILKNLLTGVFINEFKNVELCVVIVISTPSLFITFLWESFSLSIPILDIWGWKNYDFHNLHIIFIKW